MKIKILKLSTYLFLGFLFLSCQLNTVDEKIQTEKSFNAIENSCDEGIQVKVIFSFCGQVYLQILDERYYSLGDDAWESSDGKQSKHVFKLKNICVLKDLNRVGAEFKITIGENKNEDPCPVCYALYIGAEPKASHSISICDTNTLTN